MAFKSVYFNQKIYEKLKKQQQKTGDSLSGVIRKALEKHLK